MYSYNSINTSPFQNIAPSCCCEYDDMISSEQEKSHRSGTHKQTISFFHSTGSKTERGMIMSVALVPPGHTTPTPVAHSGHRYVIVRHVVILLSALQDSYGDER
jgi:hypothetical protein